LSCIICGRPLKGEYCIYHTLALQNLRAAYKKWNDAYGGLSWDEFTAKIKKTEGTGQWVLEVIDHLNEKMT